MRLRSDTESTLDGCTKAQGTRPLPFSIATNATVSEILIVLLRTMAGHVNERRLKRDETFNYIKYAGNRTASAGRDEFIRYEGIIRLLKYFDNLHPGFLLKDVLVKIGRASCRERQSI